MDPELTPESVKKNFKKRFVRQLCTLPILLPIIAGAVTMDERQNQVFGVMSVDLYLGIFIAAIVLVLLFSLWNWRCPSCSGYLGKAMWPKFCQKCGAQLHD